MTCTHPKFEIPTDPHGKHRHESAMKHVEAHEMFRKIMNGETSGHCHAK